MTTNKKPKLICIPYAGGVATSFQSLHKHLTEDWDIVAIDPPGHGTDQQPLMDDIESLVHYYMDTFDSHFSSPFALFGYSMGGKIVHRMAQELEGKRKNPEAVFIASMYPPDVVPQRLSNLRKDLLLKHLVSLGGLSEELIQEDDFIDYFLPIIRADFKAVEEHICPNPHILRSPLHIFIGLKDDRATPDAMSDWSKWASHVNSSYFNAGHMFLNDQAEDLAAVINDVLHYSRTDTLSKADI